MRVHIGWLFIIIASFSISCASLPPEKDFKTELWRINTEDYTISRKDDNGNIVSMELETIDPSEWVVVKLEHVVKEWNYEALLKKSCDKWR